MSRGVNMVEGWVIEVLRGLSRPAPWGRRAEFYYLSQTRGSLAR